MGREGKHLRVMIDGTWGVACYGRRKRLGGEREEWKKKKIETGEREGRRGGGRKGGDGKEVGRRK